MYTCTMACIVVLVHVLSKNALHWDIIEYPDYKRCPDFRVSTYTVPVFSIYYTVLVPRVCTSVL